MARFALIALSSPAPGVAEDEVDTWYDEVHIPQIRAAVPGVERVRRFKRAAAQPAPPLATDHAYFAVYEIESEDAESIQAAFGQGIASGTIEPGSVLDVENTPALLAVYELAAES